MSYPKPFLDEIRMRLPLSDVIGKRIRVQRAGREFKACCPFHKEKTPSFTINDQKGFYHCFGCGAHGDVINFVMDHDKRTFPETIETLAAMAGLQIPEQTPEQKQRYEQQDRSLALLDAATKWFTEQLHHPRNQQALSYMQDRGLSADTLARFRVGFAPNSNDVMTKALEAQGYRKKEMEKVGLIRKSQRQAGEYYAFFRDRIIFPVMDTRGRVVAFGGRIMPFSYGGPNPDMGKVPPKYLNSPDHGLFHKGRMLYALVTDVRKAVADGQSLAIVEGYMDVIALAQHGYNAAVAPLGTALTETQIEEAWRMMHVDGLKAPVLCFDGDEAGQRAAGRAMERSFAILKPDHSVHFAFLPQGHDPDTFVQEKGRDAFVSFVQKPTSLFDMMWEEQSKRRNLDTPEAMAGFKNAVIQQARQIADREIQDLFMKHIEKRFRDVFYQDGKKPYQKNYKAGAGKKRVYSQHDGSYRPRYSPVRRVPQVTQIREQILLVALINYPELFDEFGEIFGMLPLKSAQFQPIRTALIDILSMDPEITSEDLQKQLKDKGYTEELRKVLDEQIYMHAGFARPGQYLEDVREGWQDTLAFIQQA